MTGSERLVLSISRRQHMVKVPEEKETERDTWWGTSLRRTPTSHWVELTWAPCDRSFRWTTSGFCFRPEISRGDKHNKYYVCCRRTYNYSYWVYILFYKFILWPYGLQDAISAMRVSGCSVKKQLQDKNPYHILMDICEQYRIEWRS